MFQDRTHAGRELAQRLLVFKPERPVIIALPRGGIPVGYEVARLLGAPLDVIVVRKLGFPGQPELAIGAIANGERWEIVVNNQMYSDLALPPRYIEQQVAAKLNEIQKMEDIFRGHGAAVQVAGRVAIAVDDGMATGATMRVVVKRLRRDNPSKIVVAAPVASEEAVDLLKKEANQVIALKIPEYFMAVGGFYRNFQPVADEDVTRLLDQARGIPKIVGKAGGAL